MAAELADHIWMIEEIVKLADRELDITNALMS